ncbi:hypothetical protein P7C70_g3750, partial [Phenoliferia sp. Uapishka_3]
MSSLPQTFAFTFETTLLLREPSKCPPRVPEAFSPALHAPYNPALLISEEAQDRILAYTSSDHHIPRLTARAFAMTSRAWLDSGRRALYHAPLRNYSITWEKAQSLRSTLESCPHIASQVRSLVEVAGRANVFAEHSSVDRHSSHAWQVDLLKACWNITEVGVSMGTITEAKVVAATVSGLNRVEKLAVYSVRLFKLSRAVWFQFMASYFRAQQRKTDPHPLESLRVVGLAWEKGDINDTWTKLPTLKKGYCLQPRKFTLQGSHVQLLDLARLIQARSPRLNEVSIETDGPHLNTGALAKLVANLPSTLEILAIECEFDSSPIYTIDEYPPLFYPFNTASKPPDVLFSAFPFLTDLTLRGVRGLTFSKIALLSSTSPELRNIMFYDSTWDFENSHFCVPVLAAAFQQSSFPKLKRLQLGVLPIEWEQVDPMNKFVEDLRERGVTCDFDECGFEDVCDVCEGMGCPECDSEYFDSEIGGCGPNCDGSCGM